MTSVLDWISMNLNMSSVTQWSGL